MRAHTLLSSTMILGTALSLTYVAVAEEPLAPYEGRPLPLLVKQLLWEKACDIPQAEAEGDACADPSLCKFQRSGGVRFKPQQQPWMDLTMYQWAAGQNALQPTLLEAKLATSDDIGSDPRMAVAIASGLTVDTKPDDYLVQLNPLLVRWVAREVLPPPDEPMCGRTAKELYQAAYAGPTRTMVDVYAALKTRGGLRSVKQSELEKNFNERRGRYASMCTTIAKKTKVSDEEWPRAAMCWWWLRRAASGGTDELALLFGKAMRDYDPETFKQYSKALPGELLPR